MNSELNSFNQGRHCAFHAFKETLDECISHPAISEIEFRDRWLTNLATFGVIADGWYNPPPFGMAVLSGERVSFETLRKEPFWPSTRIIDWKNDIFYAYCSPVDPNSGLIGDLAITLYFGSDKRIRSHFVKTHSVVKKLLSSVSLDLDSSKLYYISDGLFNENGLKNCVVSYTDQVPLDLGHTIPCLVPEKKTALTANEKETIRKSRRFLNAVDTWPFSSYPQFTVEPQLTSISDSTLPQITYHYVVDVRDSVQITTDVDTLLAKYNLTE